MKICIFVVVKNKKINMASRLKPALKSASKKSSAYVSVEEQQELSNTYYNEALRYMDNAKECLKKAQKEGIFYNDKKYVKMACGTAYSGVLVALDGYFILKDLSVPKGKNRKSIDFYRNNLTNIDKKTLKTLNSAYDILHLWGYYDGIDDARVVSAGFEHANTIIDKIKPAGLNGTPGRNGKAKK